MSVLQKVTVYANERVDKPDWDNLSNFVCNDFTEMFRNLFNSTSYIVKGFELYNNSENPLNVNETTLDIKVKVEDAMLLHTDATSGGIMYVGASGTAMEEVTLTANNTNYIELDLTTSTGTADTRAFWDPAANAGSGAEFTNIVDTVTNLIATVTINTTGWSGGTKAPIAEIEVDASKVVAIYDRRNLLFRMGRAQPYDHDYEHPWTNGQNEAVHTMALSGGAGTYVVGETVTGSTSSTTGIVVTGGTTSITVKDKNQSTFTIGETITGSSSGAARSLDTIKEDFNSADKSIDDFKTLIDSLQTEIKAVKGTNFWFEDSTLSLSNMFLDMGMMTITGEGRVEHDESIAGKLTWPALYLKPISTDITYTINASNSTLANEEVLYINLDEGGNRGTSGTRTIVKAAREDVPFDGDTYWVAMRDDTVIGGGGAGNPYLIATDFPNTVTLYGWHFEDANPTAAWVGGKTLTENGTVAQAKNMAGDDADCLFDGSDYLNSNDAAFDFTGDFSCGCWAYRTDWDADYPVAGQRALMGKMFSSVGWGMAMYRTGGITYAQFFTTGNVLQIAVSLSPGWHHFTATRDASGDMKLYIDGALIGSKASTVFSVHGSATFEIGRANGDNNIRFTGRIAEAFVHDGTIHSDSDIQKILSRPNWRRYNMEDDLPNTTTVYGWHINGTDPTAAWIGDKNLTEVSALTSGRDHLHRFSNCIFDGSNDYLYSTDSIFTITGDFSIGIWVYRTNWAAVTRGIFSRLTVSYGWYLGMDSGDFRFVTRNIGAATTDISVSHLSLSPGWHHIAVSRNASGNTYFYIDGTSMATDISGVIGYSGGEKLEIGSLISGLQKFDGKLCEAIIHDGTAWDATQVNTIMDATGSSNYLESTDCPNDTTLYGWHLNSSDPTDPWVGGITLTEHGSITETDDYLTNDADCDFDGTNDWLDYPGDSVFTFTGDFGVSIWLYDDNWNHTSTYNIISRLTTSPNNGWQLSTAAGSMRFDTYSGNVTTSTTLASHTGLSSGWHHFAASRDASGNTNLYIDGTSRHTQSSGTITASGILEIGAVLSGSYKFPGRICEIIIHNGTVWSAEDVEEIYYRYGGAPVGGSTGPAAIYFRNVGLLQPGESQIVGEEGEKDFIIDRNVKLVRGGTWSWTQSTNTLTWSSNAYMQVPGLAESANQITAASNTALDADGKVLYVDINRSGIGGSLTVNSETIADFVNSQNRFIIARRIGNDVIVGHNSQLIKDNQSIVLDDVDYQIVDNGVAYNTILDSNSNPNLTANRTLTFDVANGDRTLTIESNAIVDQDLTQDASPEHASIKLRDTGTDHTVDIAINEDNSANRTLNIKVNDANRTIDLSGDLTTEAASIINQDVTTDADPQFNTVKITDTGADHTLQLKNNEDNAADRVLNINVNDANRTLDMSGNLTVEAASIVDQDLTQDADPKFSTVQIVDTGGDHYVQIGITDNETDHRILGIKMNDSNRNLDFTGNFTTGALEVYGNAIINGNFDVWQRGTSFTSIANAAFSTDRWRYSKTGTMVHDITQDTDVPLNTSNFSMKIDCTTADAAIAAGDYSLVSYTIEGSDFKPYVGQDATLGFWIKSTKTGIFCVSLHNSGFDRSYIAEYTVNSSDTWEYKTITFPLNYSGGTWNYTNGAGLTIYFILAAGSNFHGTKDTWLSSNLWATSNQVNACDNVANNFFLSQVQWNFGSLAMPFQFKYYHEVLSACQRYYEKSFAQGTAPGTATPVGGAITIIGDATTANFGGQTYFRVEKRGQPTMTFWDDAGNNNKCYKGGSNKNLTSAYPCTSGFFSRSNDATNSNEYIQHWEADAEL